MIKRVMRAIVVAAMTFAGAHQQLATDQHFGNDLNFNRPHRVAVHDICPGTVALEAPSWGDAESRCHQTGPSACLAVSVS